MSGRSVSHVRQLWVSRVSRGIRYAGAMLNISDFEELDANKETNAP